MYKTTSIVSATILAAMLGWTPANAADLGDDCCADLEERVNELEATTARKGNRKVSLTVSGQVNTGILYWDDGNENDLYVVDNTSSSSRFRFTGSAQIHHGWSAGYNIEVEITAGATSAAVSQRSNNGPGTADVTAFGDDGNQNGDSAVDVRQAHWWIMSKDLGKLTVGQASPATDDITLIELGGTGVVSVDTSLWGGAMRITRGNIDAVVRGPLLGGDTAASAIFTGVDSTNRSNVVRYDSPKLMGFTVSTAWGEDDIWDIALRFAGEFSGIRVAAGIGYFDSSDNTTGTVPGGNAQNAQADSRVLGSISAWHVSSGIFGTAFYNEGDDGAPASQDTLRWGLRGGWRGRLTSLGHTSVYAEYQHAEVDNQTIVIGARGLNANQLTAGVNSFTGDQEGKEWGFGVVQRIDAAAMEMFLAYKRLEFDIRHDATGADANANDQDFVFAGARIKF